MKREATATAHANIALVKYWGKRDRSLNLPSRGSLSITVEALRTITTARLAPEASEDALSIDGAVRQGRSLERVSNLLHLIRQRAGLNVCVRVDSKNSFPFGAGLASSASGMAALTLAGAKVFGLCLREEELSEYARRASGSAARSIHGGFVEWRRGELLDGSDSVGTCIAKASHWDLRVLVAEVGDEEKAVSSGEGMHRTEESSPYHTAWLESVDRDLKEARDAILERNLRALGEVTERSCLRMHADMMATDPGLLYWKPATIALMRLVRAAREQQHLPAWFTIDAGPHVKVLTLPEHAESLLARIQAIPGVTRAYSSRVGGPATVECRD